MSTRTGPVVVGAGAPGPARDALALATRLADALQSSLLVVHAFPWEEGQTDPVAGEALQRDAERHLAAIAPDLPNRAVGALSPARALHDVAEAEGAALLVVGATHLATEGGLALGSVGEALLGGAPCPVAAAPRGYADRARALERIGVAYVQGAQGDAALAAAATIAGAVGGTLELLAVADPRVWAPEQWAGRATAQELSDAQREVVLGHLEDARAGVEGATARLLVGDPAEQLRAVSGELDLLVCGSRAYGPVSGVVAGGVSKGLMHGAACPVLIVPRRG